MAREVRPFLRTRGWSSRSDVDLLRSARVGWSVGRRVNASGCIRVGCFGAEAVAAAAAAEASSFLLDRFERMGIES